MKGQDFVLQPFSGTSPLPGLALSGTVARQVNRLAIHYVLTGPLTEIMIPQKTDGPRRRIGLWEQTCFEFFLAERHSPGYWEFNLSPSGDWNVFRLKAYREGLVEEMAFASLPFKIRTQCDVLQINLKCDLGVIFQNEPFLEMAISAVLKNKQGKESLWALNNPGPKVDFHCRNGFTIKL